MNPQSRAGDRRRAPLAALPLLIGALSAAAAAAEVSAAAEVYNFTGLPAYPNLSAAKMDEATRTDRLGRQCARFSGTTFDSLDAVEAWYRKALAGASETDLNYDENYGGRESKLSGIKLAVGIDYVTIYRWPNQSATSIELFRCSPHGQR